jgi:MbtH protein
MGQNPGNDTDYFLVVRNSEGQYSIWPALSELPPGWHAAGSAGTKEACLSYIKRAWTSMVPLSLSATSTDPRET